LGQEERVRMPKKKVVESKTVVVYNWPEFELFPEVEECEVIELPDDFLTDDEQAKLAGNTNPLKWLLKNGFELQDGAGSVTLRIRTLVRKRQTRKGV
jgi:hypothetical protein